MGQPLGQSPGNLAACVPGPLRSTIPFARSGAHAACYYNSPWTSLDRERLPAGSRTPPVAPTRKNRGVSNRRAPPRLISNRALKQPPLPSCPSPYPPPAQQVEKAAYKHIQSPAKIFMVVRVKQRSSDGVCRIRSGRFPARSFSGLWWGAAVRPRSPARVERWETEAGQAATSFVRRGEHANRG